MAVCLIARTCAPKKDVEEVSTLSLPCSDIMQAPEIKPQADEVGVVPDVAKEYAYFGTYVYKISDYTQYSDIVDDIINQNSYYIEISYGGIFETYADDLFFQWGGAPWQGYQYFGINVKSENVRFYVSDTPANSISDEPNTKNIFWLNVNSAEEFYFSFLLVGVPSSYNGIANSKYLWVDRFFNLSCTQITNPSQYQTGFDNGYTEGETNGRTQGIEIGYGQGYPEGYGAGLIDGYDKAVNEGASGSGLFYGAISFIKTFFKLTTNFLGTKIIGDITFGVLVVGVPCAFMFVNLAIGLVKKFLGGRGADEK